MSIGCRFCCSSDQVAFGLISTLTAQGVRVPDDLSVVGFATISSSANPRPARPGTIDGQTKNTAI